MPDTEPQLSETVKKMEAIYDLPYWVMRGLRLATNNPQPMVGLKDDHPWPICQQKAFPGSLEICWHDVFDSCPVRDERRIRQQYNEEPIYL